MRRGIGQRPDDLVGGEAMAECDEVKEDAIARWYHRHLGIGVWIFGASPP
jgi:hypothetical protein